MDIKDRIIEAVVEKLISSKLEENQYSGSHIPDTGNPNAGRESGPGNPRNKPPAKKGSENFRKKGFVAPKQTKPLSSIEAGQSGNQRGRFNDGGDLAGPKGDPFNNAAKNKRIPKLRTNGPGGGKEGKRGVES